MLKEIVIAIQAYRKAHVFIGKHRLWKWILIPGLVYMILFTIGLYFFWISADTAVSHLSRITGVDHWLHHQHSASLEFYSDHGGYHGKAHHDVLLFFTV